MTPEQLAASGSESAHQKALFAWVAAQTRHPLLKLCFAIPNGGHRNKVTAARLKAEGVRAGIPDIFLPVPRHYYHGFFIEMKVGKNKESTAQLMWCGRLAALGYQYKTCYGWEDARDALIDYMEM